MHWKRFQSSNLFSGAPVLEQSHSAILPRANADNAFRNFSAVVWNESIGNSSIFDHLSKNKARGWETSRGAKKEKFHSRMYGGSHTLVFA
jgi:hypothetical protein